MQRCEDALWRGGRVVLASFLFASLLLYPSLELAGGELTFMAVGALLRVKMFWCHPKHVITLNAHAVQDRLALGRSLMLRRMALLAVRFLGHNEILAQERLSQNPGCAPGQSNGIPHGLGRILKGAQVEYPIPVGCSLAMPDFARMRGLSAAEGIGRTRSGWRRDSDEHCG
jgi:hypothetical protein